MRLGTVIAFGVGGSVVLLGRALWAGPRPAQRPPYFEYRLQPDETLTALALRFFGAADQWPALIQGQPKPIEKPEALPPGTVLRVPCLWHVVQSGDSLSKLASAYLRNPARWRRIYEANRAQIANPDSLPRGLVVAVPLSAATQSQADASIEVGALDCLGAVSL